MHGGTTQESTPQGHAPLRAGSVVGERYEVVRQLDQDPLSALYECRDHEDDGVVWVRLASPALCPDAATARAYAARLAPAVGLVKPHLSGLRAVDVHQGATVFSVEPAAQGTSLAAMLLARTGARMNAEELLPILAQLADALDECPPGRHHGEVRLERVIVDDAGVVQLTGAFLVAAAPPRGLATVLRAHDRLRREFAPEVLTGVARDSADLFGAGQVALQALTGERACEPGATVPARLGGVGDEIAKLIAAHPRRRPPSLTPLLEALARQAGTSTPARPAAGGEAPDEVDGDDEDEDEDGRVAEPTAVIRLPRPSSQPPRQAQGSPQTAAPPAFREVPGALRPPGADPSGTAEISIDDILPLDPTPNPEGSRPTDDMDDIDDIDELDDDAKTRQVKLAEIKPPPEATGTAPSTRPSALSDAGLSSTAPAPAAPSHDPGSSSQDDPDQDDELAPLKPGDATVKIAIADIKPPGAPRVKQGPATLITRGEDRVAAGSRPKNPRTGSRQVIVRALVAAVVIVAASLAFALFRQWRAEQDQHERVREHIEQLQHEGAVLEPDASSPD